MSSIKLDVLARYKSCAGMGCKNEGQIALTVHYLKRIGYFCNSCTEDLLKLGLAFKEEVGH